MKTRKSWSQLELEEKEIILNRFWDERVSSTDAMLRDNSLRNLKDYFLLTHPPQEISIEEWGNKLNRDWGDGTAFKDRNTFFSYFSHISSVKSVGYAENLVTQHTFGTGPASITNADQADLLKYAQDKEITLGCAYGSLSTHVASSSIKGFATTDVISTQSVTKIFTGVLAIRLMEEGVISEDVFTSPPLQLDPSARHLLEEQGKHNILRQIDSVSLHQALTHHAGLGVGEGVKQGDYYGEYLAAVKQAQLSGESYPIITSVNDFLKFIPDQVSTHGKINDKSSFIYSNSGIVLGALSLEYLYNQYAKNHPQKNLPALDFDGLLDQYVTGTKAANMKYFHASPQNLPAKFNPDDKLSMQMVGTPGGGYHSTIDDLLKFAKWLNGKCNEDKFQELVIKFGQEFCPNIKSCRIEHTGDGPFNSMFFSMNWNNGNVVIVANNQSANIASEVGRLINENILMRPQDQKLLKSTSYGYIANKIGVTPETFAVNNEKTKQSTEPNQANMNLELKSLYDQDQSDRLSIATLDPKRDAARRSAVIEIMRKIYEPTKEDYYHAAIIFQHGDCESDYRQAYVYAKKSVELGSYNEEFLYQSNHFLLATTYDRWQLSLTPPKPQKYGTQYAGKDDEKLGWKCDELISPDANHQYDRSEIDKQRFSIGLVSLDQQESDWMILKKSPKLE